MTTKPEPIADLTELDLSRLWPPPSDPLAVARRFVAERHTTEEGALTIRHWRGGWLGWAGGRWSEIEEASLKAALYGRLSDATYIDTLRVKPWEPNRYRILDVIEGVKAEVFTPEAIDAPYWLDGRDEPPAHHLVAVRNGLVDVFSGVLHPHDPSYFNFVSVPFDYSPSAPAPTRWLEFLQSLWPDDPQSIDALQQWFGYVLSGRSDLQKIVLMVGPSRSGKGVIGRVLTSLLGRRNVAGPTLASLSTNFGLSALVGKPLAIVSDARLGGGPNVHQTVERLLSISGEDTVTLDRKYREAWTGRLPTRFMILSNELPMFGDSSGAIAARFVTLTMSRSWLGQENPKLTSELLAESSGIFNWSLAGLRQLDEAGVFTEPESSRAAMLFLHDLVSPLSAFVRDRCLVGAGHEVPVKHLYAVWQDWCVENGRQPGSRQQLGRDLLTVVPTLKRSQPRVEGGGRERHYLGLGLLAPTHNELDPVPVRSNPPERSGTHPTPMWSRVEASPR